ncbi:50S ribosomal protein L28 [Hydrogenispora ethanolica]|uniref:50S ribosomal protein L28 n=1 Tax=Hydrogenispora ethanolica TaxID=1082276 RepID=UPI001046E3EC|nr:50S ribosomal protein L28 [Hydrogenispora ethanolica]
MSNRCSICGKGHQTGNLVSHSNIKTHRRWKVNLCSVKAIVDGSTRRIRVCSRCLRSNKVKRAI